MNIIDSLIKAILVVGGLSLCVGISVWFMIWLEDKCGFIGAMIALMIALTIITTFMFYITGK